MRPQFLFLIVLLVSPVLAQQPLPLAAGPGASLPRFTTDERGQPVLSWVEKTGDVARLCFSRSADGGETFGPVQRLALPTGTSTHAEGRPKLAVGADGSLVAAFEVTRPTANAPARAISCSPAPPTEAAPGPFPGPSTATRPPG